MLFRRISQHLYEQNWTAVVIDFAIVVVGVFIGIQVSNWNAIRLERQEEALLVERLQSDFERIRVDAERSLAYHTRVTEDLRTLILSLRSGALKPDDVAKFERALVWGGGFQTSADRAGTFTELLSSGRANVLRDKDLLKKLVAYEDFLQRFAVAGEYHIDLTLGALNVFNRGFELSVDKPLISDTLQLNLLGTPPVASYDFNALASDKEFRNAAEQLWFVQSFYTLWRMRIMSRVEEIQQQLGKHLNDAPVRE